MKSPEYASADGSQDDIADLLLCRLPTWAINLLQGGVPTCHTPPEPAGVVETSAKASWRRARLPRFVFSAPHGPMMRDRLGGSSNGPIAGDTECFRNACLVTALRHLGVPIAYTAHEPSRALVDGSGMLPPFGKRLVRLPPGAALGRGRHVLHHGAHFAAVVVMGGETMAKDGLHEASFSTPLGVRLCDALIIESASRGYPGLER